MSTVKTDERFNLTYIDQSSVCDFNRCPARYMFNRQMGLSLPEETLIAPDFGTCIHRALPYCYDGRQGIDKAMIEFEEEWARLGYDVGDDKRNKERARAMLLDFIDCRSANYRPYEVLQYPISAPTKDIISPNEIPFLLDIGGSLPIAGRLDAAVKWKSTGQLWALDYKTASEISGRYFNCFKSSPQVCLYTLAMTQIANERATGMIIEAIRVSAKNTETQLSFIFCTDYELTQMRDYTNRTSDEIVDCNTKGEWPKRLSQCSPYGSFGQPGRVCKYQPLCQSEDWQHASRIFTRRKPFSPFEIEIGEE